jgi:MoaA/NifB/PqqE/SkfB family radical SAM enzyme
MAGLDIVNISLDSVSPNVNSNKDFHRAIEKIDLLIEGRQKYGYAIISNQVITKDNLHEIHPLLEQLKAKGIYVAHGIKYPITDEFKRPADLRGLTQALSALKQKKSNGHPIITSEKYLESSIKWANRPSSWDCLAGAAFFTVDLDGSVLGCDRLPTTGMHISDLTKKNFVTVRSETRKMNEFQKCSKTCMINCDFETSYICSSPYIVFKALFQTIRMASSPAPQKTGREDHGESKGVA